MFTAIRATGGHLIFQNSSVYGAGVALDLTDCSVDIRDSNFMSVGTVLRGDRLGAVNAERLMHTEKERGSDISLLAQMVKRASYGYV